MIYSLWVIFFLLLLLSYILFEKELMHPAVIFCIAYFLSIGCACLNVENWGIKINLTTYYILFLGGVEFIAVSYLVGAFLKRRYKKNKEDEDKTSSKKLSKIRININILYLFIIYEVIVLFLLYVNVLFIAKKYGEFSTFSEMLKLFKAHTSYSKDTRLPSYLTMMMKPIVSCAYIGCFIFLNNFFASSEKMIKKIKENYIYLVFPALYAIQRFLESNRGSILNLCFGFLAMAVLIWSIKYNWERTIKKSGIIKFGIIALIGLMVFYLSASLIGRENKKKMFDYITFYVGGSIECFNRWIGLSDSIETVRGEYTFGSTINDLYRLGIVNTTVKNSNYSTFIYHKREMVGNIYTSYRSWMHDWGIPGVIILQAILSVVYSLLYYTIRYNKLPKIRDYLILLYGFMIYVIFCHPIDSYFYLEFFTIANTAAVVLMTILFAILKWSQKKVSDV